MASLADAIVFTGISLAAAVAIVLSVWEVLRD